MQAPRPPPPSSFRPPPAASNMPASAERAPARARRRRHDSCAPRAAEKRRKGGELLTAARAGATTSAKRLVALIAFSTLHASHAANPKGNEALSTFLHAAAPTIDAMKQAPAEELAPRSADAAAQQLEEYPWVRAAADLNEATDYHAALQEIAKQERAARTERAPPAKSVAPKAATSFAPKARATPHAAAPLHARARPAPTAAPPRDAPPRTAAPPPAEPGPSGAAPPRTTPPPPDASEAVAAHVAKVCSTLGGAVPEGTTWPARRDVYADREVALSPADQEIARPRFFDTAGLMGAAYRVGACVFACCVLAFFSVASPASRSNQEYNLAYKLTLQRVFASFAPPVVLFLLVFDARHATCIDAAKAFFSAFGAGFVACVGAELLASTFIWNQALEALEPEALRLVRGLDDCPLRFPTVLRDHRIPIQRRTQLLAELVVSCVAAPILEEAAKLWAARRAAALRDAAPAARRALHRRRRRAAAANARALRPQRRRLFAPWRRAPAPPALEVEAPPPTPHVHTYLTHCLASAIGFKMADATRRICLYNRPWHPQKMFFAVVRGALPIHELCAALTASRLARRDAAVAERLRDPIAPRRSRPRVLGPLAVVLPAALLHASANFRGAKPVYKWESNQPWVELQLQAWNQPDDAAPAQLLSKSVASFMWWGLLLRIFAYACHEYFRASALAAKHRRPPRVRSPPKAPPF